MTITGFLAVSGPTVLVRVFGKIASATPTLDAGTYIAYAVVTCDSDEIESDDTSAGSVTTAGADTGLDSGYFGTQFTIDDIAIVGSSAVSIFFRIKPSSVLNPGANNYVDIIFDTVFQALAADGRSIRCEIWEDNATATDGILR